MEGLAQKCFALMNRNGEIISWEEFKPKFDKAFEAGEVFYQFDGEKIIGYLRGKLLNLNGDKVFWVDEMACVPGIFKWFLRNVVMKTNQFFQYVGFYRKKNDFIYMIRLWLPGNKYALQRLIKGEELCQKLRPISQ